MRAKFTTIGDQIVLAEYDGHDGVRVRRTFFCDAATGYDGPVLEEMRGSDSRPVCLGLAETGHTVWLRDGEELIDVVRREYRAMVRA